MIKYYVVWKGRKTGIYGNWDQCKKSIDGFKGAKFKSFPSIREAQMAFGIVGGKKAEVIGQVIDKPNRGFYSKKIKSTHILNKLIEVRNNNSLPQNEGVMPGAGSSIKKCGNPQGEEATGLQAEGRTSVGMLNEQRVTGQDANDLFYNHISLQSGAKAQSMQASFMKESVKAIPVFH